MKDFIYDSILLVSHSQSDTPSLSLLLSLHIPPRGRFFNNSFILSMTQSSSPFSLICNLGLLFIFLALIACHIVSSLLFHTGSKRRERVARDHMLTLHFSHKQAMDVKAVPETETCSVLLLTLLFLSEKGVKSMKDRPYSSAELQQTFLQYVVSFNYS